MSKDYAEYEKDLIGQKYQSGEWYKECMKALTFFGIQKRLFDMEFILMTFLDWDSISADAYS